MELRKNTILMINVVIILVLILITKMIYAQEGKPIKFPNRSIGLSFGPSYHQKQKLAGCNIGLDHKIQLNKTFTLHNAFVATLHVGNDPKLMDSVGTIGFASVTPRGSDNDIFRFVTAGIQTSIAVSAALFSGKLKIGMGPLLRYQTTTYPDDYSIVVDVWQGQTTTIIDTYYKIDKIYPHTLSLGGLMFAEAKLFTYKKINVSANLQYQFDNRNDNLFSGGLIVQRAYKKTRI